MKKVLVLIGFMGSGKTTVGRLLSERLSCPFADLDDVIVEKSQMTIPQIFQKEGEKGFRKREQEALVECLQDTGGISDSIRDGTGGRESADGSCCGVLSLGGGTPCEESSQQILSQARQEGRAYIVYLRARPGTVLARVDFDGSRPMLNGASTEQEKLERVKALMQRREELYRCAADLLIDTDVLSAQGVSDKILEEVSSSGFLPYENKKRLTEPCM